MKRIRTLLTITVVSLVASTAFAGPIHTAAEQGNLARVRTLLNNGADVNAKNNNGQTPLDSAVDWKHHDIAEIIRKHQALALVPKLAYGGDQQLLIDGAVGQDYDVLYSSDLKEWDLLDTITIEDILQVNVDDTAEEEPARFYQLQLVE